MANDTKSETTKGEAKSKDEEKRVTPTGESEESKLAGASAKLAAAEGELAKLEAAFSKVNEENAELRAEVRALKQEAISLGKLVPVRKPKGSLRVLESVIVTAGGVRAHAKRGDVLLLNGTEAEVYEARLQLGQTASAYAIDEKEARELLSAGLAES